MNDELETKEYLKSVESIKLADSTRLRMKEDLLSHARFYAVTDTPAPIKSPFTWFALKPVQVAFTFALILGTSGVLFLNKGTQDPLATLETQTIDPTTAAITPTDIAENNGVPDSPTTDDSADISNSAGSNEIDSQESDAIAFNTRAKSTPTAESAMADDSVMSTMVSQGTWSVTDYQIDITRRMDAIQSLIKKYDAEFSSEQKTAFLDRLDAAEALRNESAYEDDARAYELLDKATVLVGEVEAELSLLGQIIINEEGMISDIDFSVDPTKPHEAGEGETGPYPPEAAQ